MVDSLRACVFDAYGTLLDVHSAVMRNADEVGASAEALSMLWRQRQLEYSWTRTLMHQYADFWQLTDEALTFALRTYHLEDRKGLKDRLMSAYKELSAYPDAAETLEKLKSAGYIVAILSNGNDEMLQAALKASKLDRVLDSCLSADDLKIYKPDPRIYQFACDRLGVNPNEVCFVSSNAWDLGGAGKFGFNTVRINRQGNPPEYEFAPLKHQVNSLSELWPLLAKNVTKAA
ncbi:Haloacid dehalogenase, type II, Deh4a [Paraburkholderia caribensis MBA4]|uniref:(S)-2-haloacid dehalogenase 4A n=2 Tax=Burkholderiaceae TaxID=119060 RepID=HAD4_BURCE|nr:haloacid dehalogenase type II [Paraburkholderia caribensis]Q51645.3 RecName: Full=(S)-2-haloacid dehalogenase 4A; AltName: Full=2-haloalkanoic acid dehalogenase IVA; AltName: Full=Halocarboxylic acid halidohydrolase IVA; AltName: Full=L-2-haloacid dehalogenase IVA [Burkholderia cepacia]ALL68374.1 Haloacid dehalogenase, type II, Deh4a [Paraburkholderia caribensis MBA4]CAA46976.1 2-haloacid halidohydrolase IVa [Burkholderia cepacia]